MSSNGTTPTAPTTKTDVQWVGFVTSTTGFAAWLANRLWFHSAGLPTEVAGIIQYGVPLTMGAAAAEWRWLMAKHREPSRPPTSGQ